MLILIGLDSVPAPAQVRSFKDALGRTITLERPPRRIVSLAPSCTEMLFGIGLDEAIVGVTRYCNYPPQAKERTQVGGYYDPSLEKIVALRPDLVVMSADGYNQQLVDRLTAMGIPCYVIKPRTIPQILETMQHLAEVTGVSQKAAPIIARLKARLQAVEQMVAPIPHDKRVRVFYALGPRELWTTGGQTYLHDLIERAGGINVAAKPNKPWYQFSPEKLILADPDIILTGITANQTREEVIAAWQQIRKDIPAVAKGRFCLVDTDSLSRPGPRAFDVLETLVRTFYPDRWKHKLIDR